MPYPDDDVNKLPNKDDTDKSEIDFKVASSEIASVEESSRKQKASSRKAATSERQFKFERAQKCLENAALVTKRIKEHRKATAELLGRPFEEADLDVSIDSASSIVSESIDRRSEYGTSSSIQPLSVEEALNIPGISESLANTLKQKEILMEKIKQYKAIQMERTKKEKSCHRRSMSNLDSHESKKMIHEDQHTLPKESSLVSDLQVKIKAMEHTIHDLQEKISEKDSLLVAKTKASSLLSEGMSKKEKNAIQMLEETRTQMVAMQENFCKLENEWNDEKKKLDKQLSIKSEKISHLEEANAILENERFQLSIIRSKYEEELKIRENEINELQTKVQNLSMFKANTETEHDETEKGSIEIRSMNELTKKIEFLEQINYEMRQANIELECKLSNFSSEAKSSTPSPKKVHSPQLGRKGRASKTPTRNPTAKSKSPWKDFSEKSLQELQENKIDSSKNEIMIQALNKQLIEKEIMVSNLTAELENLKANIVAKNEETNYLQSVQKNDISKDEETDLKIIEYKSQEATDSLISAQGSGSALTDLEKQLLLAQEQIGSLTSEIDIANKNMIKVKSAQKLRVKQLQKTIDNFSKVSDANSEVIRLTAEVSELQLKIAELEEDKGNLQLHLVDYDSGRFTESEVQRRLNELENIAEVRLKAISELEAQKFNLVQELHQAHQNNLELEDKVIDLTQLESETVSSEIKSAQLEEQIEQLQSENTKLSNRVDLFKCEITTLHTSIQGLEQEKAEMSLRLEQYAQENLYLNDKLEKMSTEKVSSAESIEIVESLTTQEKLEMEELNKVRSDNKVSVETVPPQIEENKNSLEGNNELLKKIDLFSQERHEVMQRMDILKNENISLSEKIEELSLKITQHENNIKKLNDKNHKLVLENNELLAKFKETNIAKSAIKDVEISSKECSEAIPIEVLPHDEKIQEDRGKDSKVKNTKQLMKDILKLKNTIKEREEEIADYHMKVLSLEEQNQKLEDRLRDSTQAEEALIEEKTLLQVSLSKYESEQNDVVAVLNEEINSLKKANDNMVENINAIHCEYQQVIATRESKIQELEMIVQDSQKSLSAYNEAITRKDSELADALTQIAQLNVISQKLRSTIELLEEEKARNQNGELIKSLNNNIHKLQSIIKENEIKMTQYKEERNKIGLINSELENKALLLENEVTVTKQQLIHNEQMIKQIQEVKTKTESELNEYKIKCKEKDEELHEIKLQLRKESIEYDSLRKTLDNVDQMKENYECQIKDLSKKLVDLEAKNSELLETCRNHDQKNKDLMERLKKFAANLKKKASVCTDLEMQMNDLRMQLEQKKNEHIRILEESESTKLLNEKISSLKDELTHVKSGAVDGDLEIQHNNLKTLYNEALKRNNELETEVINYKSELERSSNENRNLVAQLEFSQGELNRLQNIISETNLKLTELETVYNGNQILQSKINSLEQEVNDKQNQLSELLTKLDNVSEDFNKFKHGHEAKLQERDLYLENLQSEITKYKNRISRLEESISIMEERRHSIERKADRLDDQLHEKQKAYTEYVYNEDELVNRLAILMDHDQVVEKQLTVIEKENMDYQMKIQKLRESNENLNRELSTLRLQNQELSKRTERIQDIQLDFTNALQRVDYLENQVKKITSENEINMRVKTDEIHALESEFHSQIENTLKEKKGLMEKTEKLIDHSSMLEAQLKQYQEKLELLTLEANQLRTENEEYYVKSSEFAARSDYTEKYIAEINNLQSIINQLTDEKESLLSQISFNQSNYERTLANINIRLNEAEQNLQLKECELTSVKDSQQTIKEVNDAVMKSLEEKNIMINNLNTEIEKLRKQIHSTNISHSVQSLSHYFSGENKDNFDDSFLQSQIISPDDICLKKEIKRETKQVDFNQPSQLYATGISTDQEIVEEVIVPKKAYECYPSEHIDPFNSEEGWGLGDESKYAAHDIEFQNLHDKISALNTENQKLRSELSNANAKITKALKKLKEMKLANESLTMELKLSKQMSQYNTLDAAIETELNDKLRELEAKNSEMSKMITKVRSENENIAKQNEVINSANEKLMEMKEKMDNEIELWKFKFKEANDKISQEDFDQPKLQHQLMKTMSDTNQKKIIEELEKENNEYTALVEDLNVQIKQLTKNNQELLKQMRDIEVKANSKLAESQISECDSCKQLKEQLQILEFQRRDLSEHNDQLQRDCLNLSKELDELKVQHGDLTLQHKADVQSYKYEIENFTMTIDNLNAEVKSKNSITNSITEIESNYKKLQNEYSATLQKLKELEGKCSNSSETLDKINELEIIIGKLNEENSVLLATVADLQASMSSAVDQRGLEVAEMWKQHISQREADFLKLEQELRSKLTAAESKYEGMLDDMQSSTQDETTMLIMTEQLSSLQSKLKDKEDHLMNLQIQYADVLGQLNKLRSEFDNDKLMCESKLLSQQGESEKALIEAENKLKLVIKEKDDQISEMKFFMNDLEKKIELSLQERDDLQQQLNVSQEKVETSIMQIKNKDVEIYQKTQEFNHLLQQKTEECETLRQVLIKCEKQVEDLNYEKESELAILRLKLHETKQELNLELNSLKDDKTVLAKQLEEKIKEGLDLNKTIYELKKTLEEYLIQIEEMKAALESQELELVTMKDEVNRKVPKHVSFASNTRFESESPEPITLTETVPRAELDLALYMLHQRDVRCEELTVELTHLLDERDTLQLRLSNCLRAHEELKTKCLSVGLNILSESKYEVDMKDVVPLQAHSGSPRASVSEDEHLQTKLTQLKTVRQIRDVRLIEESEQRQREMELLNRDVANLPAEAAEQLRQAHHTISHDQQSTSTVLLNWLRGKNTQKVVHM